MRPERPLAARVIEGALSLTEFETKLVVQSLADTREDRLERHKRRRAGMDLEEMLRKGRESVKRFEMRTARVMEPAAAWRALVSADESAPVLERWFAGVAVPKGGVVAPQALHAAWGAWNVEAEPTTIDPVLVLASDLEGMRAAEELALATCSRLGLSVRRVTWFVEHETRLVDFRDASRFRDRLDEELAIPAERLTAGEYVFSSVPRHPREDAWRFEWLRLAKRDLVRANVSPELRPLVDLWHLGYALVDVVGDSVVLAGTCPQLRELLDVLL